METKYDLILVIIDTEQHDTIIEACEKANAPVYTAFSVKGTVGKKSFRLLAVEIENPKEIILVLTPQSKTDAVKKQIIESADLDNPENGFLLVLDVKDMGGFSSLLHMYNLD